MANYMVIGTKEDRGYYEKAFTDHNIEFLFASKYLEIFKNKKIKIRRASWESTENELKTNIPFSLWQNPKMKFILCFGN